MAHCWSLLFRVFLIVRAISTFNGCHAVYPSATLVKDNTGRLPVHYVNDLDVKRLLMKASAPLSRAGITDSFSRFVT